MEALKELMKRAKEMAGISLSIDLYYDNFGEVNKEECVIKVTDHLSHFTEHFKADNYEACFASLFIYREDLQSFLHNN